MAGLLNPAANRIGPFNVPAVAPGAVDSATITRQSSRKRALSTTVEEGVVDDAGVVLVQEQEEPLVVPPWFGPAMGILCCVTYFASPVLRCASL
jgi:hypothetical protein